MKKGKTVLKRVSDIPDWDPTSTGAVRSGFAALDKILGGGFRPGEVTIWSGTNSSGESTLLGQVLLEAIDQGHPVCAYSGELPERIFRYWLELQGAGPDNLEAVTGSDPAETVYRPNTEAVKAMRRWYRDYLFLYDGSHADATDNVLEAFVMAAAEYNSPRANHGCTLSDCHCHSFPINSLLRHITNCTII